ncbi:lipoprotein [Pontibacter amylolyticus]|uniref:Lipoprotein n=2 Tax=Pontibacter amylolyticus TaxID=1424080 RepID=A0ABQ1W1T4_9BACT|nr:lipoprotein [Pontibacter amylolyticus]
MKLKYAIFMKTRFVIPFLMSGLVWFSSCDSESDSNGTARMEVRMTDAPGDYEEVNVDIRSVQIHKESTDSESGWQTLDEINPGVYNLLDFANGRDTLLASANLPAGTISQIRLVLGENNSLKLKNGDIVGLKTPSGQTSGVKLQLNADLREDVTYVVLLDFDAAKSVVARGNGQYNLKPVVRTITQAVAGGIKGRVTPAEAKPGIYVISAANDTIGGFANENGDFLIKGVKAGTYSVKFYTAGAVNDTTLTNISVSQDQIKDLGTVKLPTK